MDKRQELENLIEQINILDYRYYTLDKPSVSDGEYDKLYDRLVSLQEELDYIPDDSPTNRVGGAVLDKFEKHYHLTRLLSQDKAQSYDQLSDWIDRCERLK